MYGAEGILKGVRKKSHDRLRRALASGPVREAPRREARARAPGMYDLLKVAPAMILSVRQDGT